jgi:hypothetical protein
MDELRPPVLEEKPTVNAATKFVVNFALFAPVFAVSILVFCIRGWIGMRFIAVAGLLPVPLILLGLLSSLVALAIGRKVRVVFWKALIGICVNGLFMTFFVVLPLLSAFSSDKFPATAQGRLDKASNELAAASSGETKFYALDGMAKESFNAGKIQDARKYANELLSMATNYPDDWNFGNAIQDGNLVLGRIALLDGKIDEARNYLLEAGKSRGSPQMDSFGPNMSLAKDLLEKGETNAPLQYFELCRNFWKMDYGKLDEWSKEVKAGQIPDFGANLVY